MKMSKDLSMIKATTTKATYRGIDIIVISSNDGHGTTYSCTNNSGRPRLPAKWFSTQAEALANEKEEINLFLR
ncbi:MAG: hypothetical protein H6Q30_2244 [Bacteroidetes bacterium]|nr:hypothetical protein [Bacteroidota bacterium]